MRCAHCGERCEVVDIRHAVRCRDVRKPDTRAGWVARVVADMCAQEARWRAEAERLVARHLEVRS